MIRRLITPMLAMTLTAACSAAPPPEEAPSDSESQALCGNGIHPGCGDCYRDPASRTGGSRTCWTCDGSSHKQTCSPPPVTIAATWSGHMWIWTPKGPTQGDFTLPIVFTESSSGSSWTMAISPSTVSLGVDLSISGSGPVSGDNATLTVPVSAQGTNATLTLSTTTTITPPGQGPISGVPYSGPGNSFQMLGSDPSGSFKAFVQGTITAWP